jgi:predicted nucleic acid-binding Zn ribbon protein
MNTPRKTPRNNMALRFGVLAVVIVAIWFVVFR